MTWGVAFWLAFRGGRSDRLRIALTAASSALATVFVVLAGAIVAPDADPPGWYPNPLWTDPGLRGGLLVAVGLLCLPPLALAAQCSRVGAPARDRRYADLALVGTTRTELRRLAALEAGVASVLGVVVGLGLYVVLALLVDRLGARVSAYGPDGPTGKVWQPDALVLPTDRTPAWTLVLPVLVLLPVLVTTIGLVARGRRATGPPTAAAVAVWTVLAVPVAAGVAAALTRIPRSWDTAVFVLLGLVTVAFVVGLVWLSASTETALGRLLVRRAGSAATLLAGRRMAQGRRRGWPALTLLSGCAIGGAALVLRADALAVREGDDFFVLTYALVVVGLGIATAVSALGLVVAEVEGVVERRRSLASAVAAGVPRVVLARAAVIEGAAPLVPAVVVAGLGGAVVAAAFLHTGEAASPGFPVLGLVIFLGFACVAVVLASALATLALPASTDISEARVPA